MNTLTDRLIGRSFVTKSFNQLTTQRLGDDAIRFKWKNKPSLEDIEEAEKWAEFILTIPLKITRSVGATVESINYEKWKNQKK